jgi:hypothetical protein
MNWSRHLMLRETSDRIGLLVLVVAVGTLGDFTPAVAQAPPVQVYPTMASAAQGISPVGTSVTAIGPTGTSTIFPISGLTVGLAQATGLAQGPLAPPLEPPAIGPLPSGVDKLSAGPFLLFPSLGVTALYDHNIYSSPTAPLSGPAVNLAPALLADYNTGIFDTQLYANANTTGYPALSLPNSTFNWQAGFAEKYSPLRDLVFNVSGNYAHSWLAFVTTSSLPTPVVSPASPALPGAAGVVALQQITVNPNDTATATASVYKEFNRAFINLGATFSNTQYEMSSASFPNFETQSLYGNGAIWVTPSLFVFSDGVDASTDLAVGPGVSSFRARAGIGTAPIGLFRGSLYYGRQGTEVGGGGGTAGGPIYGGALTYLPTPFWNVDFTVDELINVSNITALPAQGGALGGLPFVGAAVGINESTQITTVALKSNYVFSPQTTIFGVLSNSRIAFIGSPRVDDSWLATIGVQRTITQNLTLSANFQYNTYLSPEPATSFTNYVASLGAVYAFGP